MAGLAQSHNGRVRLVMRLGSFPPGTGSNGCLSPSRPLGSPHTLRSTTLRSPRLSQDRGPTVLPAPAFSPTQDPAGRPAVAVADHSIDHDLLTQLQGEDHGEPASAEKGARLPPGRKEKSQPSCFPDSSGSKGLCGRPSLSSLRT